MKNVIRSFAIFAALTLTPHAFALTKTVCTVEFKLNSSVTFEKNHSLKTCLEKLNPDTIQSVFVLGSATPTGSFLRNKQLATERAMSIARIVRLKFPGIPIEKISVGVSAEIGKKSQAYFLINHSEKGQQEQVSINEIKELKKKYALLEEENQRISLQNQELSRHKEQLSSSSLWTPYRVAFRLGGDNTRGNVIQNYLSFGGEFSFLHPFDAFQTEVGFRAATSTNEAHLYNDWVHHVTNAYVYGGVEKNISGMLFGLRTLVGYEWIDINEFNAQSNQFALGGEARLGYQWDSGVSVVASYGLTKHLQMVDLSLGYGF